MIIINKVKTHLGKQFVIVYHHEHPRIYLLRHIRRKRWSPKSHDLFADPTQQNSKPTQISNNTLNWPELKDALNGETEYDDALTTNRILKHRLSNIFHFVNSM